MFKIIRSIKLNDTVYKKPNAYQSALYLTNQNLFEKR